MRVLSRKCQCPSFICFSKSTPSFYSPPPLKLEDAQHASSSPSPVAIALVENGSDENVADEIRGLIDGKPEALPPKSCLKKPAESGTNGIGKGRVKWMDFTGKELVEIKEFETTESGDSEDDSDGYQTCICVIQ